MSLSTLLELHRRPDSLFPRNWIFPQSRRMHLVLWDKELTSTMRSPGAWSFPRLQVQSVVPAQSPIYRIPPGPQVPPLHMFSSLPILSNLSLHLQLARLYRRPIQRHSTTHPTQAHIFHLQLPCLPARLQLPTPPLHPHPLLPANPRTRLMIILFRWRRNMPAGQFLP